MSFDVAFDFRATSGYVTDPSFALYELGTTNYPTTNSNGNGQSVTYGWESGIGNVGVRDRSSSVNAELAGIAFVPNNGTATATFRIDLPSTGSYNVRLAICDQGNNNQTNYVVVKDTSTAFITFAPLNTTSANVGDAAGNSWSASAWPGSNVAVTHTFSSTILRFTLGGTSDSNSTVIASIRVTENSVNTSQTQSGKSRIKDLGVAKTQSGIARIKDLGVTKTQAGVSRIKDLGVLKTQSGKSRITATTLQTQSGVAHVVGHSTQTQAGVASISASYQDIVTLTDGTDVASYMYLVTDGGLALSWFDGTTEHHGTNSIVPENTWTFVVITKSGTTALLYVNGELTDTLTVGSGSTNTGDFNIGSFNSSAGELLNGSVDEARFSSSVRSADWILTEYNNQSNPGTFITVGSEESTGSSQTQSGKSRITATTHQTQSGKGNVKNNTIRTQAGISRVNVVDLKTQSGLSRIGTIALKTQLGVGRIHSPKFQTGVARITATTTKTQNGSAAIKKNTARTQSGQAWLSNNHVQTQSGKSRMVKPIYPWCLETYTRKTNNFANQVLYLGAYNGDVELTSTANDLTSQAELGRVITAVVANRQITTQAALDLAAGIELDNRAVQEVITYHHYIDGLEVGMMVTIESTNADVHGSFVVQQVTMTQLSPTMTKYVAQVGDYQGDLYNRIRQLSVITTALPPVPPPAASVTTASIVPAAVTTDTIAPSAVTGGDGGSIAADTITSANILSLEVNDLVVDGSISGSKLEDGSVDSVKISSLDVETLVVDGSISGSKLADGSVTSVQIASATITSANIASLDVDLLTVDGSISGSKLADGSVAAVKISSISADQITSGTISATISMTSPEISCVGPKGNIHLDATNGLTVASASTPAHTEIQSGGIFGLDSSGIFAWSYTPSGISLNGVSISSTGISIGGNTGVSSATFTTADGKTCQVRNGLIISIV